MAMDVDPVASLRCWAIDVELGGRTFEVPALPASDWFPVLSGGNPLDVLDLIPSSSGVDDLILSGEITADDLIEALSDAIAEVSGRPFHYAVRLSALARMKWSTIGGDLSRRGFRWDVMPIGAALDALYLTFAERVKAEDIPSFDAMLNAPLPSLVKGKPSTSAGVESFEVLAGPKPTGVKSTGARSGGARPKTRIRRQPTPQGDR